MNTLIVLYSRGHVSDDVYKEITGVSRGQKEGLRGRGKVAAAARGRVLRVCAARPVVTDGGRFMKHSAGFLSGPLWSSRPTSWVVTVI